MNPDQNASKAKDVKTNIWNQVFYLTLACDLGHADLDHIHDMSCYDRHLHG